jgi:protein-tyrosine kinase
VSKIFQALERAELERAHQRTGQAYAPVDSRADGKEAQTFPLFRKEHAPQRQDEYAEKPSPLVQSHVDRHLVSLLTPIAYEAESYRVVCHRIAQLHKEMGLSLLAISSPSMSDGKTISAINIAATLAQLPETKTLLVDLDLRRSSLPKLLGWRHAQHLGVRDLVLGSSLSLDEVIQEYPSFNFDVLLSGSPSRDPHEVLKEAKFAQLLEEARRQYDYVILDTPPFIPFPDCRFIEPCVDGVVLVVKAHQTSRKLIAEAIDSIDPTKIVGILFNNDNRSDSYYYSAPYSPEKKSNGGWGRRLTTAMSAPFQPFLPKSR